MAFSHRNWVCLHFALLYVNRHGEPHVALVIITLNYIVVHGAMAHNMFSSDNDISKELEH